MRGAIAKKARWIVAAIGGLFLLAPATAQGPELAMLQSLEKGSWEIRIRDDGRTSRVCLARGTELIQIQHKQSNCGRFVVEDMPGRVTVQYTCTGHGYGRTTIRREGARLVQIQSQGIQDGLPFDFTAEARRVGSC